jgi:hypothetical protein
MSLASFHLITRPVIRLGRGTIRHLNHFGDQLEILVYLTREHMRPSIMGLLSLIVDH